MSIKLDSVLFDRLLSEARQSPRKRSHFNLHQQLDEPVQRLCIGLLKGTYVRPHHHSKRNKWELMIALQGSLGLVIFDAQGVLLEKIILRAQEAVNGMEIPPNTWHSVYPVTDEAVIIEVKEGPYTPAQATDFAQWAPQEGDDNVTPFLQWMEAASPGEKYPA